jgi:hypothetical protein
VRNNGDLLPVTPRLQGPKSLLPGVLLLVLLIRLVSIIIVPSDVLEPCLPLSVLCAKGRHLLGILQSSQPRLPPTHGFFQIHDIESDISITNHSAMDDDRILRLALPVTGYAGQSLPLTSTVSIKRCLELVQNKTTAIQEVRIHTVPTYK